ncbi:apoptotic chromatin condensation inducer in the nucleus [Drosophila subpulchrella]|uniref:apoptotic chromatin condensation inducer in the nucleus n=1 Tax=Drosophila subpulchrella TaxID=1486046 RepID=UPI0018A1354B|nr:apoptotic chromatin condensation inducer in the nucleus [Drosophila subpulchrella]XP_037710315.1 apoptotic chromatin condensation inducer in the nucleus [Drosophila subpulchrella]
MRRRSERKKSSSPAPVPVAVARRSRRSRKVSENEKTEDEAPVAGQKDIPDTDVPELPQASVAREEINEARASSEERAGSGSSPVRKSRGSRTTPKKRTEAKGGDKKVDTIPEEEPENGQDAAKDGVEEEKAVEPPAAPESESEDIAKKEDQLTPVEESKPEPIEAKDKEDDKEDEKQQQQQDAPAGEDDSSKPSEPVQEVKVPSPSSKDEEHLKTSSDVLDIQTEEVEERDEEAPAPAERRESKKKHKEPKQEQQDAEEEEQKENRKQQKEKAEHTQDEPADLPNDKHEASVNSSASNTTTAPVLQQQRSVRKRKWLTNKKSLDRAPPVLAISTDSLKNIIADVVQPVPLSDVQLDSSSEEEGLVTSDRDSERSASPASASEGRKDRDTEAITVTTTNTGAEATTDKEDKGVEATGRTTPTAATDTVSAQGALSKATVATAAPHIVRDPSPARNRASHVLYITNLVRPFTVLQLKGLLARTGKIVEEDGFWIDRIKSKCFVAYSTEDEAIETRHALHGVRWPVSNPKCLNVDFGSRTDMDRAILSTKDEAPRYGQENTRDNQQAGNAWSRLEPSDKKPVRPVREWDVGKKEPIDHDKSSNDRRRGSKDRLDSRSRDADRAGQDRKRSRDREGRGRERERERNDRNIHARSRSGSPVPKSKRKENEPPIRLLDDLFRKTKVSPCIYWLPLTPEAIAEKEALRQKRIEEHNLRIKEREERQKEREKERDRQRDTRRNRSNERRRSRSRERERRRY